MRHPRVRGWLRISALVALCAALLHQARYLVGHGGEASEALARDGHAHMGVALPVTLLVALLITMITLVVAAFAHPRRPRGRARDPRVRALECAFVLFAVFCTQELVEGALSASHPGGFEALFGHGGAAALPLAVVLGCLVSLTADALGAAERHVAGSLAGHRLIPTSSPRSSYRPDVEQLAELGLVFGFARRPPPSLATGK
jgi:hypothetical protein